MSSRIISSSIIALVLFVLIGTVAGITIADQKATTAMGTVPSIIQITIDPNIILGDISPSRTPVVTSSISVFSTAKIWMLNSEDGTNGGTGFMVSGSSHLGAPFELALPAGDEFVPLSSYASPYPWTYGTAGNWPYSVAYRQAFTSGDRAGSYQLAIKWTCNAIF